MGKSYGTPVSSISGGCTLFCAGTIRVFGVWSWVSMVLVGWRPLGVCLASVVDSFFSLREVKSPRG
jgi:hypothetical protein